MKIFLKTLPIYLIVFFVGVSLYQVKANDGNGVISDEAVNNAEEIARIPECEISQEKLPDNLLAIESDDGLCLIFDATYYSTNFDREIKLPYGYSLFQTTNIKESRNGVNYKLVSDKKDETISLSIDFGLEMGTRSSDKDVVKLSTLISEKNDKMSTDELISNFEISELKEDDMFSYFVYEEGLAYGPPETPSEKSSWYVTTYEFVELLENENKENYVTITIKTEEINQETKKVIRALVDSYRAKK